MRKDRLVNYPFVKGALRMLDLMLGIEGRWVDNHERRNSLGEASCVYASTQLTGSGRGEVALITNRRTARNLVAEMLAKDSEDVDDATLFDGVSEMVNIVAGYAKSDFSGTEYEFDLSLPSVRIVETYGAFDAIDSEYADIKTDYGTITILVRLKSSIRNTDFPV